MLPSDTKFTASIQVTTHSHLLSRDELDHVSGTLSLDQSHIHVFSLQEFDTELDFSNKVRYVQSVQTASDLVHCVRRNMTHPVMVMDN